MSFVDNSTVAASLAQVARLCNANPSWLYDASRFSVYVAIACRFFSNEL